MDELEYRLRCEIYAHSNDVRTICVMDNAIVSGSRDLSVKLWTENNGVYENSTTLKAHTNYISSVCVLPQTENFPVGLIVTGGHDNKIFGFVPYTENPILCLEGHMGPVCCLSVSKKKDFLLSSSWDCSAKMWNVFKQQCIFTIYGHAQTIWAVIHIPFDYIITGSADKTIKVFNSDGEFMNTLSGHTDCVRGLSYLYETIVISCGNDGTVRTWNVRDGSCLDVKQLNSNYIYSVKAVYDQNLIALGCEDKILCVIHGNSQQNIVLPAQSVWAVDILPNSDIVVGSSDGYIRIFTTSSFRKASCDKLMFKKQLTGPAQSIDNQPGPNHLVKNFIKEVYVGEFDGQLKFLKVLGTIKCYKWSVIDRNWFPVENMTIMKPKFEAKKHFYEGEEYDYIFDIDVEGKYTSPLKLPFNIGEDPQLVTERFIKKHSLSPKFTSTIISFLMKRSIIQNTDVMETGDVTSKILQMFNPPDKHIFFQKFDGKILKQRLNEFWEKQLLPLDDPTLEYVKTLILSNEDLEEDIVRYGIKEMIKCIESWPESLVYPILDIARISLLRPKINIIIFKEGYALQLWSAIERYMQESSNFSNKMFVCRLLCNMFSTEEGINFIFDTKEFLFSRLPMSSFSEKHRGFEIALASLLLNLSMEAVKRNDTIALTVCLEIIQAVLMLEKEEEAVFRLLVALGTLSLSLGKAVYTRDVYKMLKYVTTWKNRKDDSSIKASRCAKELISDYVALVLESGSEPEGEEEEEGILTEKSVV